MQVRGGKNGLAIRRAGRKDLQEIASRLVKRVGWLAGLVLGRLVDVRRHGGLRCGGTRGGSKPSLSLR